MRSGFLALAAVVIQTAHLAACTSLLGSDYRAVESVGAAGGSTGGAGGADPTGGVGGEGGVTLGGSGGQGGVGGAAPLPPLVDDGVVARYYLDEAASGTSPPEAKDALSDPLNLTIWYANTSLSYAEVSGHRGLEWLAAGDGGAPYGALSGTKGATMLGGSPTLTVEVVADVDEAEGGSRLLYIGNNGSTGRLGLRFDGAEMFAAAWNGNAVGEWPTNPTLLGRSVFHLVIDTEQAAQADRVRLYVAGVPVAATGGSPPGQGATLSLFNDSELIIGNRDNGGSSIRGRIYYAALYASALDPDQIDNNVTVLLADDDTPAPTP